MIPLLSSCVLPLIARKGLISGDMKRRPSGVAGEAQGWHRKPVCAPPLVSLMFSVFRRLSLRRGQADRGPPRPDHRIGLGLLCPFRPDWPTLGSKCRVSGVAGWQMCAEIRSPLNSLRIYRFGMRIRPLGVCCRPTRPRVTASACLRILETLNKTRGGAAAENERHPAPPRHPDPRVSA